MKNRLIKNLLSIIPFLVVLSASFFLLIFIGIGEAYRVYPRMHVDNTAALGETIKNPMDAFLSAGLPLDQFMAFAHLADSLLKADPASEQAIAYIEVRNRQEQVRFPHEKRDTKTQETWEKEPYQESTLAPEGGLYNVTENAQFYKISFPLENKFEVVGTLQIYTPKAVITDKINSKFFIVWFVMGGLILIFALISLLLFRGAGKATKLGIQVFYIIVFLLLASFVMYRLFDLYSDGIQEKTKAMASSLRQRLDAALELGLDLTDLSGIDELFREYKEINPDISFITLTADNKILIHTDPAMIGREKVKVPGHIEEEISLFQMQDNQGSSLNIGVGIPQNVIYAKLFRSGKNFIVLFIASAFLSFIFLNLLFAIRRKREFEKEKADPALEEELKLGLITPLFFLAVFLEGLFVSFLPQFFEGVALASNLEKQTASLLFTIYFISFVVSLIPSGWLAGRTRVKGLLMFGALLFTAGYFLLIFFTGFLFVVFSRVLSGFGQGIIFIGVQSYILRTVSEEKKTRGTSIIVYGYNGGMIAGTAIGALLATYLSFNGVFFIAACTGFIILLYVLLFIPGIKREVKTVQKQHYFKNLGKLLKDFEFIKTIVFVGIITKAVLTGVNSFALPLVLKNVMKFPQDDIGQILIFYSGAVLISTLYVSKIADKWKRTALILFLGTQLGGIGLYVIGFMNMPFLVNSTIPYLYIIVLLGGMVLLGFAHGFIHAPIVTHIARTKVANTVGVSGATSIYRFLERIGHVAGPLVVGPLLYGMGSNPLAISWIGIFSLLAGIAFMFNRKRKKTASALRR